MSRDMLEDQKRNELFSQVAYSFSYPMVLFHKDGVIHMANRLFCEETGRSHGDVAEGRLNMLDRATTENCSLLEAVGKVFLGETILLEHLEDPLSMFIRDDDDRIPVRCGRALLFPLDEGNGMLMYGVAVFMKQLPIKLK